MINTAPKQNKMRLPGHGAPSRTVTLPPGYSEPFALRNSPVYCCVVVTYKNGKLARCSNERKYYGSSKVMQCCRVHVAMESAARAWMSEEEGDG